MDEKSFQFLLDECVEERFITKATVDASNIYSITHGIKWNDVIHIEHPIKKRNRLICTWEDP